MANTTNYNWETPDDTDLVKDGAAAIRTLGNSIDTTTKALNPETTLGDIAYRSSTSNTNTRLPIGSNGQILGVSAGVPAWINNDQGDITEVQAGTGISVASGTGPIPVVTNTVATAYDAKGDLVVGTGADTFSRLAVGGTNGHTLQVDSSTSTGLKWAAAGGGGDVVRITTNTFSAVSAVDIDSIFSATYQNYLILMAINSSSGSNAMNLRFRASGSTNTTSNYGSNWEYAAFGSGGATGQLGSAAGSDLAYISDITGGGVYYAMHIFNPQASERTLAVYSGVQTNSYRATGALQFAATTSFDGISFISAAGNITGNYSVYGFKNS